MDSLQAEHAKVVEFKEKLAKSKKENQDLKYDVQKKTMELE
jgi:hypothetical protein